MQLATRRLSNLTIIAIVAVVWSIHIGAVQVRGQTSEKPGTEPRTDIASQTLIFEMMDTQTKAWNEGDLEAFMLPYWKSPNLTFSSGGKTTRGWQATLDQYKKSYDTPEKMGELTFSELQFQSIDSNAALILGQWKLKRKDDSPRGNFSLVWRRIEGNWKIIHDHSSTLEDASDDDP